MTAAWEGIATTLVEKRGEALLRYARFVTGDVESAGDLVHDALVKTFGKLANGFTLEGAEAYVRRAILTAHIDATRRRTRWRRIAHLTLTPETIESSEVATGARLDLATELRRLSPRERACLVLRFYEDLPVRDIARELGIGEGTVKRYLSDGLSKMQRAMRADQSRSVETQLDDARANNITSPNAAPVSKTGEGAHHGR